MKHITTSRLELHPLSLNQLCIGLNSISKLSDDLALSLESDLFEGVVSKAVNMKIEKMKTAAEETHEWFTYWLIVPKVEKIGVGLAGFKGLPDISGSVEIGYGLNEKYRGKGYMSEAVKALVQWAFFSDTCNRVTATSVFTDNIASQKVLLNAGFKLDSATSECQNYSISKINVI
ncbi:MAG: hypothetical protein CVU42_15260 [Chloroflexi bacterium HGW-Chloroflexi-4]|jgi:RimJ/RimL family protein N-acetyltransferase|nr:MAG: hypothetical protein CVU42_15260 [Chloroflexi bacterium HGW-Chloroflexi-4]